MLVPTRQAVIAAVRAALVNHPVFTGDDACATEIATGAYDAAVAATKPLQSEIEARLEGLFGDDRRHVSYITAAGLTALIGSDVTTTERGRIMQNLGFRQEAPMIGGVRTKIWARGPKGRPADIPRIGAQYYPVGDGVMLISPPPFSTKQVQP
jgi:hypothetical protein